MNIYIDCVGYKSVWNIMSVIKVRNSLLNIIAIYISITYTYTYMYFNLNIHHNILTSTKITISKQFSLTLLSFS